MKHTAIDAMLKANKMLAPRERTDVLFPLSAGSFGYRGYLDEAIRFIESYQLLDRTLWSKFVKVFTEQPKPDTKDRGWRGEYWGKMMRGACITYQYTQSPALYKILTETVEDMLQAPEADGRISAYDKEAEFGGWDIWCRKYVLLGLEYFLEICTDETLADRVLKVLCGEADTLVNAFGKDKRDITKASTHWEGVNSSSVLEPIVRLYNLTGDKKYLDFASYIVERGAAETQNLFEMAYADEKAPFEWQVIKAYEIMSCFEGLIEYYRVTGIEKWRDAALRFGRRVYEHEVSIIGSCGCWHELFDNAAKRQLTTLYTGVMQETCVTVTWMKFCLQLLCLSGNCRYADEIERTVYNAMTGAINYDKSPENNGFPFDSYSPLVMGTRARYTGGHKILSDGSSYGCCACIGSAGTGLIPMASMLLRRDGIAVNLYIPGAAATKTPDGSPLEISVKTEFPKNGTVTLTIDTTSEEPFTLALRIPGWSYRTALAVNAEMVDVTPGTYAELTRVWKCGDTVELFLDMRTEVIRPDEAGLPDANSPYHVALRRGPMVLARDRRLSDDLHHPVDIAVDKGGFAQEVLPLETAVPHTCALRIKQCDSSYLEVIDYASAGRTWDNRSVMSAWMHTKPYFAFDPEKPFRMMLSCRMASAQLPTAQGDSATKCDLFVGEDHKIHSPAVSEEPPVLTITDRKGDNCHLMIGDKYLTVVDNEHIGLANKGTTFTLLWQGHNCYAIKTPDGRLLRYGRTKEQTPLFLAKGSVVPYNLFDFVNVN